MLHGIRDVYTKESLTEKLREQNEDFQFDKFEVKHSYKTHRGDNWIIEVDPDLYLKLKHSTKINLDWLKFPLRDYTSVTQCFNCFRFGHIAKFSKAKRNCRNCGSEEHGSKQCEQPKHCANYFAHNFKYGSKFNCNHQAVDKNCSIRLKETNRLIANTDYGVEMELRSEQPVHQS